MNENDIYEATYNTIRDALDEWGVDDPGSFTTFVDGVYMMAKALLDMEGGDEDGDY